MDALIITAFEREIKNTNNTLRKTNEVIEEDFMFAFERGYVNDKYKTTMYLKRLNAWLEIVRESKNPSKGMQEEINRLIDKLITGNLHGTSNSVSDRQAYALKLEVDQKIIEFFKRNIND